MKISLPSPTPLNKGKECSLITSPLPEEGELEKVNHSFSIFNFQFLIVKDYLSAVNIVRYEIKS